METIYLQLFPRKATKNYETDSIQIKQGRIHLLSLLKHYRLNALRLMNNSCDSGMLLQYDSDGAIVLLIASNLRKLTCFVKSQMKITKKLAY